MGAKTHPSHADLPGLTLAPGLLLVLLTALISGVSTFVNFWAVQGSNSDAFITARNLLVAALLVPMVLLVRRDVRVRLLAADWMRLGTIGLVGGAIPFVLFFRGLQMAGTEGAATATFGYRTLFLMTTVLAVVFLRERLAPRVFVAAGLLLGGNALLLSLTSPVWSDGTLLVLGATGLWAVEYTLSKRAMRDLPSSTVALGRMGFGGAFLAAYLVLSGQAGAALSLGPSEWPWIGLSAVLLVGFVATWYAGLRTVPLSTATSVLVLAFPITWALGVLAGRSSVGLAQAAGASIVAVGAVVAVGVASLRETWDLVLAAIGTRPARSSGR